MALGAENCLPLKYTSSIRKSYLIYFLNAQHNIDIWHDHNATLRAGGNQSSINFLLHPLLLQTGLRGGGGRHWGLIPALVFIKGPNRKTEHLLALALTPTANLEFPNAPRVHVFGPREEARVPRENPQGPRGEHANSTIKGPLRPGGSYCEAISATHPLWRTKSANIK